MSTLDSLSQSTKVIEEWSQPDLVFVDGRLPCPEQTFLKSSDAEADQPSVTSTEHVDTLASAPHDLFDLAPQLADDTPQFEATPQRPTDVRRVPIVATAVAVALVGLLFHFPIWAMIVLPFSTACAPALSDSRRVSRLAWVVATSAILAQITDAFITPFVWPERLLFFAVLLGAAGFWWGTLMDAHS
jgi:hypothetical protein